MNHSLCADDSVPARRRGSGAGRSGQASGDMGDGGDASARARKSLPRISRIIGQSTSRIGSRCGMATTFAGGGSSLWIQGVNQRRSIPGTRMAPTTIKPCRAFTNSRETRSGSASLAPEKNAPKNSRPSRARGFCSAFTRSRRTRLRQPGIEARKGSFPVHVDRIAADLSSRAYLVNSHCEAGEIEHGEGVRGVDAGYSQE